MRKIVTALLFVALGWIVSSVGRHLSDTFNCGLLAGLVIGVTVGVFLVLSEVCRSEGA